MEYRFTQDYESNSWEFFFQNETPEGYVSTENITNAMNYLKSENNFRLFSEGLTKLMEKCGYRGSLSDPEEKAIYLYNKLCTIGTPPSKFDNIKKWFTGPQRPALDSKGRIEMFQVCFALSANINDTVWFFHHVYFDRSFNCRTIEEAVFYYCLKNKKSYEYSLQLINEIEKFPETHSNAPIYTSDIQNALNDFESVEDLFAFFKKIKIYFMIGIKEPFNK